MRKNVVNKINIDLYNLYNTNKYNVVIMLSKGGSIWSPLCPSDRPNALYIVGLGFE